MGEEGFTAGVLLLANCSSYLVTGLCEVLKSRSIQIIELDSKQDGIKNVKGDAHAIVIYADASVIERNDLIIYAKDYAAEKGIKIFIIGGPDELASLMQTLDVKDVEEKFTRPIDVVAVADKITNFVTTHNSLDRKSILAVDDSGVFLREINSWFAEKYKVTLVNSGLNAIKYLGSHRPDLILLDYEMPICNGKQVL